MFLTRLNSKRFVKEFLAKTDIVQIDDRFKIAVWLPDLLVDGNFGCGLDLLINKLLGRNCFLTFSLTPVGLAGVIRFKARYDDVCNMNDFLLACNFQNQRITVDHAD